MADTTTTAQGEPEGIEGLLRSRTDELERLRAEIKALPAEEQLARHEDLKKATMAVTNVERQISERAEWDAERMKFRPQPATQADEDQVRRLAGEQSGGKLEFERSASYTETDAGAVYIPHNANYHNPAEVIHRFADEMKAPISNMKGHLVAVPGLMERALGLTDQQKEIARDLKIQRDYPLTTNASGGFATDVPWVGLWTLGEHPGRILDVIPRLAIDKLFFWGTVQTTRTSNAREFTQTTGPDTSGTGNGVSQFAFARGDVAASNAPLALIHIISTTDVAEAALQSEPMLNDILMGQGRAAITQRLGYNVISGDGTGNNMRGFLNLNPALGEQAWDGNDDQSPQKFLDTCVDGRTAISTSGVFADENSIEMVVHPTVHDSILKARDSDNRYLFDQPNSPRGNSYYGMRLTRDAQFPTPANDVSSGVLGDFANGCRLVTYGDVMVDTSNSHRENFEAGLVTIRFHIWAYLYVPIGSAFRQLHRTDS